METCRSFLHEATISQQSHREVSSKTCFYFMTLTVQNKEFEFIAVLVIKLFKGAGAAVTFSQNKVSKVNIRCSSLGT